MQKKTTLKKGLGFLAVSAAVMFFWAFLSAAVVESPDEVIIDNEGWPTDTYEPVTLTHNKHVTEYNVQCKDCHHVYEDGKNVWEPGQPVQKCIECHNVLKLGKELREASDEEKKLSMHKAYHDNCVGCHRTEKKGPVKCLECHAKKAK